MKTKQTNKKKNNPKNDYVINITFCKAALW